jgi:CTP synthase (UTP-ammonia lyase)
MVQIIPHVANEIRESVYAAGEDADVVTTELRGTKGDNEGQPFSKLCAKSHWNGTMKMSDSYMSPSFHS